jgi:DNA-directed RNA polymerase subunit A'
MKVWVFSDEMNIIVPQNSMVESELINLASVRNHLMSQQNGTPNICIVQDSLVGSYLLTKDHYVQIEKGVFMNMSMGGVGPSGSGPLYTQQKIDKIIEVLKKFNKDPNPYTGHGLFSLMLPDECFYENKNDKNKDYPTVKIYNGVLYEGTLSKAILGARHNSLLQYLFNRFGDVITQHFINNVQFLMVDWVKHYGFSIGINDTRSNDKLDEKIKEIINASFTKAESIDYDDEHISEVKISGELAGARDSSLKEAKELIDESNGLRCTIEAGSKGDYFNATQLTGLLGQQLLKGRRLKNYTCHFPSDDTITRDDKYKARGFVSSSFGKGLDPHEFFAHAMAGREGIVETAVKTGESGYAQRRMIKALEDMVVSYNRSVPMRQICYGENGLNPARCFMMNGKQQICNVFRLVDELNYMSSDTRSDTRSEKRSEKRSLTNEEVEYSLDFIKPQIGIPRETAKSVVEIIKNPLREQLYAIKIYPDSIETLRSRLERVYHKALIEPGEAVGIIAAQQMGSRYTQESLDSFQKAGANNETVNVMDQILNCSKNFKGAKMSIYPSENLTISQMRKVFNHKITELKLSNFVIDHAIIDVSVKPEWYEVFNVLYNTDYENIDTTKYIKIKIDPYKMYWYYITLEEIAEQIENAYSDVKCVFSPDSEFEIHIYASSSEIERPSKYDESLTDEDFTLIYLEKLVRGFDAVHICGIPNLGDIVYVKDKETNQWYMEVSGTNYSKVLELDDIDLYKTTTNDIWELYNTAGIEAVRLHIIDELGKDGSINHSHIKLIADHICHTGTLIPVNRYGNRQATSGVLTRASYEETCKTIIDGASNEETEYPDMNVSSSIICGKAPNIGSNYFKLKYAEPKGRELKNAPGVPY